MSCPRASGMNQVAKNIVDTTLLDEIVWTSALVRHIQKEKEGRTLGQNALVGRIQAHYKAVR